MSQHMKEHRPDYQGQPQADQAGRNQEGSSCVILFHRCPEDAGVQIAEYRQHHGVEKAEKLFPGRQFDGDVVGDVEHD